jgi:hypothetical protein
MGGGEAMTPDIAARYQTLLILWFSICMSLVMFMVLIYLVATNPAGSASLGLILESATVVPFALSFLVKQHFLGKAISEQKIDFVQPGYVAAFALCEASALLGLLDRFVNGSKYFFVGFVLAGLGMLSHFPRRKHLVAALGQKF